MKTMTDISPDEPLFEWTESTTEAQAFFLEAMRVKVRSWSWPEIKWMRVFTGVYDVEGHLVLSVEMTDKRRIMHCFRVDLYDDKALVGDDFPADQFTTPLDPSWDRVFCCAGDNSEQLADAAATQLHNKILEVFERKRTRHRRWFWHLPFAYRQKKE